MDSSCGGPVGIWVGPDEDARGNEPVRGNGGVPGDELELEGAVREEGWEERRDVDGVFGDIECGDADDGPPEGRVDAAGEDGCEGPGDAKEDAVGQELDLAEGGVSGEGVSGAKGVGEVIRHVSVPELFVGVSRGGDGDGGADCVRREGNGREGAVLRETEVRRLVLRRFVLRDGKDCVCRLGKLVRGLGGRRSVKRSNQRSVERPGVGIVDQVPEIEDDLLVLSQQRAVRRHVLHIARHSSARSLSVRDWRPT